MIIPRDPRKHLWVFSLAAVSDDGLVEFHCHYGLAVDEETAGELAIEEAVAMYPQDEGYGQHTIAVHLVPKAHLLAIARAVL
jgi:hypothetical protein